MGFGESGCRRTGLIDGVLSRPRRERDCPTSRSGGTLSIQGLGLDPLAAVCSVASARCLEAQQEGSLDLQLAIWAMAKLTVHSLAASPGLNVGSGTLTGNGSDIRPSGFSSALTQFRFGLTARDGTHQAMRPCTFD
jgi:hypothetical protein